MIDHIANLKASMIAAADAVKRFDATIRRDGRAVIMDETFEVSGIATAGLLEEAARAFRRPTTGALRVPPGAHSPGTTQRLRNIWNGRKSC